MADIVAEIGALYSSDGHLLAWAPSGGGQFTFQLTTAAFKKLSRTDTWRWVTQERIQNDPAEQYVGRGSKNITLEGVIYASYNPGAGLGVQAETSAVGTHVLDNLRNLADAGQYGLMIDGRGNVLGNWVLVGMKEEQEYFLVNGAPQKQGFMIEFRSYGDDNAAAAIPIPAAPPAVGVANGAFDQLPAQTAPLAAQAFQNAAPDAATDAQAQARAVAAAKDLSRYMTDLGNAWGQPFLAELSGLLQQFQSGFGLSGQAFKGAMNLYVNAVGAGAKDADSILNKGIGAFAGALSGVGVNGAEAAADTTAAISAMGRNSNPDRGASLSALATQMTNASNNTALKALGVNFNDPTVVPSDRYASGLNQLAATTADPSKQTALTSALPPGDNAELYEQAGNKATQPAFDNDMNASPGMATPYGAGSQH